MPLTLFCPAKINLFLEVLGRRPDGFHEIVTVMVPIDLGDRLTARRARTDRLTVTPAGAAPVRGNTVLRAVAALRRRTGFRGGVELRLAKRVPPGSGLGAGSSDAAAALRAVDRLHRLGTSEELLQACAAEVGSDVPFFLSPRPALAAGRGTILAALPRRPPLHFLLLFPPRGLSTAEVYSRLPRTLTDRTGNVTDFLNSWSHPDCRRLLSRSRNALESPALDADPALSAGFFLLRRAGLPPRMSGSGSTLFSLLPTREAAETAARKLPLPLRWRAAAASMLS